MSSFLQVNMKNTSRNRTMDKYKIIFLGFLVHFLLLFAVFDVYFASPLDHGMPPVISTDTPAAKRLVLFVADGLRAASIYNEKPEEQTPFLTEIMRKKGSWGVAHTRVPTESRPGHIAILAGIYEDPSAIFKGWKANPVNFDSVFNQSTNAWCWGSPDIVNVFNKDNLSKIHLNTYDAKIEDFGKDTGILDTFVFNKAKYFFKYTVKTCKQNCKDYFDSGNIYFLHLLGIDTAGHGYKPHSNAYKSSIKLVDDNIKMIMDELESVFQDNSTSYIFTADHGMTDWGSHGAGSVHETEVPIIVWGVGIKQNPIQQDINQIDIAPLISALIGINIPVNSLGVVPIQYLNFDRENLAKVVIANAEQLLRIFNVKRSRICNTSLFHVPFQNWDSNFVFDKINRLKQLQILKKFDEIIHESRFFMEDLIQGINYYHNYYQYPVLVSVSLGFIVWILFVMVTGFRTVPIQKKTSSKINNCVFTVTLLTVTLLCIKCNFPTFYFIYFLFPFVALWIFSLDFSAIPKLPPGNSDVYLNVILYLIGIELLVYGFFNRKAYSVLMVLLGIFTLTSYKTKIINIRDRIIWMFLCVSLAVFPTLPVMKTSFNLHWYSLGYIGCVLIFIKTCMEDKNIYTKEHKFKLNSFILQFSCLHIAAIYVFMLEFKWISNESSIKSISWFIFLLPILLIPMSSKFIATRLAGIFFGFAPFYLLVSTNFEVLFSVVYVSTLAFWLFIETKYFYDKTDYKIVYFTKFENYKTTNEITMGNFRRAFLFMVFLSMGFFGTGNIASLNSFDPMWVRAFLTVFSPFKMTGLIILKLIVPFIFTCCVSRAINAIGKENVLNMFCIILIFSDLMLLQFMYLITNVGSWLDIGTSLSHFLIMEAFVIILLLLYGIAHLLTSVNY